MRCSFSPRFSVRRREGAALVIILAFVVLLAVLVLAFFSRAILARQISNASANQTKVDLLARGAIDVIVADIRQEIEAGSTNQTNNGFKSCYPLQATNMLPARSGNPSFAAATNDPIPNLVRRSVRNDSLVPNQVGVAASAVNSTSDPSANGRTISAARWNAHYLIPRQNAGSATVDSRPITNFVSPDWVMVTKDGPKTLSAPDASVIGRYAYAIYDEGGLLDANIAGYPGGFTNYPSAATNVVAMKGSAALADLSQIGITNSDNLVGWRNYATARPSGSLGSYAFDATSLQQYWSYLTNVTNSGFLSASTNSFNSRSDQIFTSRQALLKFQRAAGLPQDALQYLGTFSRTLEQASIRPDPNRPKNTGAKLRTDADLSTSAQLAGWGGNDAYDAGGALQDQINPSFLAAVRSNGQPVAKRRFPLSRLAAFEKPVADTVADMKRYFGLVWDATAERWNYASPDGNAAATYRIKTLGEVAAVGREPDFFEVLKAAITCDSLGKQNGGNEGGGSPARFTSGDLAIDGYIDLQIFQIGANIIDQADADGYPTAIRTADGPIGAGSKPEPPSRTISGAEDLPYLYGWMSAWYRTRRLEAADILPTYQPPGGKFPYETATLLQPVIWNPHAPNAGAVSPDVPTQFRVVAGGVGLGSVPIAVHPMVCSSVSSGSAAAWWPGFDPDPGPANPPKFPANDVSNAPLPYLQAVVSPANSWITFETALSGKATFREPQRLQSPNYPLGSNASSAPEGLISKISAGELADLSDPDTASAYALGIYTGRCWTGPTTAGDLSHSYLNMGSISKGLRLELQYKNASGNFITYDTIDYAYCTSSLSSPNNLSIVDNDETVSANRGMRTGVRADPRTNRWGLPTMRVSPTWDSRVTFPTAANAFPLDPVFTTMAIYRWAQGQTLGPDGTTALGPFYRALGDNQGSTPKASGWKTGGGSQGRTAYSDLEVNMRAVPEGGSSDTTAIPGGKTYYTDPDGVLRRAAGAFFSAGSRFGLPLTTGNFESRPVILNRPFRSVAELGYAFRGVAWKDIDFFTPESGDAALLDAFCLNEIDGDEEVVAGRVNLNTRQPRVLAALINGVSKAEGGTLSATESLSAANALVTWTADSSTQIGGVAARGPLRNRSELVGKFVSTSGASIAAGGSGPNRADVPNIDGALAYSGYSSILTNGVFSPASDTSIKRRHESVIRALADAGDTRTWNLLIDLVAQTGRYGNSGTTDLAKFIVEGETRYWLHIAIDRFTGEVIGKQLEVVGD